MKRPLIAAGTFLGAIAIAAPVIALPPGTERFNKSYDEIVVDCGEDGRQLTVRAPENLWPPNHKYYNEIFALAESDNDEEAIDLVTRGSHDQYEDDTEINGSGNTGDDITIGENESGAVATDDSSTVTPIYTEAGMSSVQTDWRARAERSGTRQEGRTYTFQADAYFAGEPDPACTITTTIVVPHDMRKSNRNNGEVQPADDATAEQSPNNGKGKKN